LMEALDFMRRLWTDGRQTPSPPTPSLSLGRVAARVVFRLRAALAALGTNPSLDNPSLTRDRVAHGSFSGFAPLSRRSARIPLSITLRSRAIVWRTGRFQASRNSLRSSRSARIPLSIMPRPRSVAWRLWLSSHADRAECPRFLSEFYATGGPPCPTTTAMRVYRLARH
jgi:hypothetical protein